MLLVWYCCICTTHYRDRPYPHYTWISSPLKSTVYPCSPQSLNAHFVQALNKVIKVKLFYSANLTEDGYMYVIHCISELIVIKYLAVNCAN